MNSALIRIYTILICVSASLISQGLCLKCFQCNSQTDTGCADLSSTDSENIYLKPCKDEIHGMKSFCRKTKVAFVGSDDKPVITDRSCGWILAKNKPYGTNYCFTGNDDFRKESSCQCFTEGCNISPARHPLNFLINILIISSLYFLLN